MNFLYRTGILMFSIDNPSLMNDGRATQYKDKNK